MRSWLKRQFGDSSPRVALGVRVDDRTVRGVVVQEGEAGCTVLHRSEWELASADPAWSREEDDRERLLTDSDDVAVRFDDPEESGPEPGDSQRPIDLSFYLGRLVEEAGRPSADLPTGFALAGSWVSAHRLEVPEEEGTEREMIERLEAATGERVDAGLAGWQVLRSDGDVTNAYAVVRRSDDPVTSTFSRQEEKVRANVPPARHLDAESTLLIGLARMTCSEEEDGPTVLVHLGRESTLVAYLVREHVLAVDRIYTLTTLDTPDTVARRILLCQDELGVSSVGRMVVSAEEEEQRFVRGLEASFSSVPVTALCGALGKAGVIDEERGEVPVRGAWITAVGAAIRVLSSEADRFFPVDLLESGHLGRKPVIRTRWHTWAAAAVLFVTVFGLTLQIHDRRSLLATLKEKVRASEVMSERSEVLNHRLDSLNEQLRGYQRALGAVDSLVVGTDRWSRMLETIATRRDGLWLEELNPEGDGTALLSGYATSRARIVRFARRLDARVRLVESTEIRDYRVYRFEVEAPVPGGFPRALRALRERGAEPGDSLRAVASGDEESHVASIPRP